MKTSIAAIILALFKSNNAGYGDKYKFSHCGVNDKLVGWWKGKNYDGTIIKDLSKNGNNIVTINDGDNSMNVVNNNYLEGDTGDNFILPTSIYKDNYTFLHVSKYRNTVDPTTNQRIWTSSNGNWLSGHWMNKIGMAYHENWITQNIYPNIDSFSETYQWILSTDQTDLYRMNGIKMNLDNLFGIDIFWPKTIGINVSPFTEYSDFGFSEALLFDYELNIDEILCIESYLIESNKLMNIKLPTCNVYKLLSSSNLIGYYGANGYENIGLPIIKDMSINNNDIIDIGGTIIQNGNILQGTTNEYLRTPFNIDTSDYTIIYLAKYNTSDINDKKRILTSMPSEGNWLSGFWENNNGVAYHGGWITSTINKFTPNNAWVVSTDVNNIYRGNGIDFTTVGNNNNDILSIGINIWNNEHSDWALYELMVFDKQLKRNDYICMEQYMCNKAINDGLNVECNIDYLGLYKSINNNNNNNNYINKEKCMCHHKKPCQHNNIGDYTCYKKNKWGQCPNGTTDCNKFDYIQLKYPQTPHKQKKTTKQSTTTTTTKQPKKITKKPKKIVGKKKCCNIKKPCLHDIGNYCMSGYGKGPHKQKCWPGSTLSLCV